MHAPPVPWISQGYPLTPSLRFAHQTSPAFSPSCNSILHNPYTDHVSLHHSKYIACVRVRVRVCLCVCLCLGSGHPRLRSRYGRKAPIGVGHALFVLSDDQLTRIFHSANNALCCAFANCVSVSYVSQLINQPFKH